MRQDNVTLISNLWYLRYFELFFSSFMSVLLSSSPYARSVTDIGYHGLPILSVVSSPDELIVGRVFSCYEVIQTVCAFDANESQLVNFSKDIGLSSSLLKLIG